MMMSAIPPGDWTLTKLRDRYPWIEWEEPVRMEVYGGNHDSGYGCRICIANTGIKASDISDLPSDPEVVREHIRQEHSD